MKCSDLKQLKLDEPGKIGYTFKTLGSGFWALKQTDFRKAITKIVLQVDILTSFAKYFLFLSYFFWNIYFDIWYPLIHIKEKKSSSFRLTIFLVCISLPCIIWALSILQYIQLAILRIIFTYAYFFSRNTYAVPLKYYWCKKEMPI